MSFLAANKTKILNCFAQYKFLGTLSVKWETEKVVP